ncbi:MAG: putative nucleoside transporter YegT [Verrucomicrobiota bacterium]|jgi:nucleoside transporter
MNPSVRTKLSLMMFLQYLVWGAWFATGYAFLTKKMGFTDVQAASCYATTNLAAMIAPFFMGMIADRFFAAERVLGVLHLLGALFIYLASQQTSFGSFYPLLLAHTLCYMPTMALTNSVAFAQMSNPGRQFPGVRVLGTIGWIAAGQLVSMMKIDLDVRIFHVAAIAGIVLGIFSFTLPHTPPRAKGDKASIGSILGLDALSLMKDRSFAIFMIGSFLICIPLAFYYNMTGSFLADRGVTDVAGTMSWGQMSEIFFMLVFPLFFARLGVKWMLVAGMVAWAARYMLFAGHEAGASMWPVYLGVILHGICYDFFFVTGQVYVDERADAKIRSAAQGFIAFATYGLGMFVGSYIQGAVAEKYTIEGVKAWDKIWTIPAVGAFGVLLLFMAFFRSPPAAKQVAA